MVTEVMSSSSLIKKSCQLSKGLSKSSTKIFVLIIVFTTDISITAALRRHIYRSTLGFGAVRMQNKNINLVQKSLKTLKTSAFCQNINRITY